MDKGFWGFATLLFHCINFDLFYAEQDSQTVKRSVAILLIMVYGFIEIPKKVICCHQ